MNQKQKQAKPTDFLILGTTALVGIFAAGGVFYFAGLMTAFWWKLFSIGWEVAS